MKYIIVVDKQSRTNPSTEKRETTIEIEELRRKGNIHDDFVIDKGIAKVYRRLGLTKTLVTYVLDNEVIEDLGEIKIKLFEGDNYIYIKDEYNNQMCAEFVIKNDFTDSYVTNLQMESAIDQTAKSIILSINQILEGYSTTEQTKAMIKMEADSIISKVDSVKKDIKDNYDTSEEVNSKIEQKANSITSSVSETYSTKTQTAAAKTEAINSANESTDDKLKSYSTTTQMNSAIEQKANSITSSVSETYSTKQETNVAKTDAIDSANASTDNKLQNYTTLSKMQSVIEQYANEMKSIISASITSPNLLLNSDFSNGPDNWVIIESTDGIANFTTINNKRWFRILNSESGGYTCKLKQTLKPFAGNVNYTISLLAKIRQIEEGYSSTNINFKFIFYDDTDTFIETVQKSVSLRNTLEEQKISATITSPNNNISYCLLFIEITPKFTNLDITNLQLEKGSIATDWNVAQTEFYSMVVQKLNEITMEVSKKVNDDEFSTKLSMDYESVQIAWNKISEFIQFLDAQLQIKDGNKKLLMLLDKNGQEFYNNGLLTGKIGSTQYKQDITQKGLAFNLDKNGKFMCWGKISSDEQSYITKLWYSVANSFGNTKEGVYLGTNLMLNDYSLIGKAIEICESTLYRGDNHYFGVHIADDVSEIALFTRAECEFYTEVYIDGYKVLTNTSDGRLKKDIYNSLISALDTVAQIKHRQFTWKKDNIHEDIGYIAQELEEINPNYVHKNAQYDEDGNIIDYTYQVNLLPILATATKAIQELNTKVNEQQQIIEKQQQFINLITEKFDLQDEYNNIFNTATVKKARARKEQEIVFDGEIQYTRRKKQNKKHRLIKQYENGEVEIIEEEEELNA